jgi:uroporphyrinogen-III synthase
MSDSLSQKTLAVFSAPSNKKLISQIRFAGSQVIEFPSIEAQKIELSSAEKSLLSEISQFDWLIFSDVYSVEFFLKALEEIGFDFFALDSLRVLACGEAISDQLRFVQIHADVIPASIETEIVFAALRDYLFDDDEFKTLRFFLPKEASAEIELTELLRRRNASVTELNIYRLEMEIAAGRAKLKALLKGGAIDEFVFTAPSNVSNLAYLFDERLKDLLAGTVVSATDESTFQTLREHELKPLYFKKR